MMASIEPGDTRQRRPWRMLCWAAAAALLLIPLVAGWPWTPSDYIFAAVLFGSVGGGIELAFRMSGHPAYRLGAVIALLTALLLVWINAAVGIIGSEDNPANLVFTGILAIAIGGSVVAAFRPAGMARAMGVTAAAQALVAAILLSAGFGAADPPGPTGVLILNAFFTALWLAAAALFRRSAGEGFGRRVATGQKPS